MLHERPVSASAASSDTRPDVDPTTRLLLAGSLVILTGLAWSWTVRASAMPDCHVAGLPSFLLMWTVMMAAMMFPAIIPVVLAFTVFSRGRAAHPGAAATVFVAGYLIVWSLLGLPAYALLGGAAWLMGAAPPLAAVATPLGGAVLIACGVYQLTPLKDACLRHCRVPQLFLAHHWRDGLGGALRLGAHHGLYCAGCCVSIMIVLLIVGVMNLGWMVALSALIYLEKVLPGGRLAGRLAGVALGGAGVLRIVT